MISSSGGTAKKSLCKHDVRETWIVTHGPHGRGRHGATPSLEEGNGGTSQTGKRIKRNILMEPLRVRNI